MSKIKDFFLKAIECIVDFMTHDDGDWDFD